MSSRSRLDAATVTDRRNSLKVTDSFTTTARSRRTDGNRDSALATGTAARSSTSSSSSYRYGAGETSSARAISGGAGQRWLLVTSAFHMPRSIGAFRKAGFEVEAYPVDWRTSGTGDALLPFARLSAGLARMDVAVHEWIGLIGYWATGRSSELFPGPRAR